MNPGWRSFRIRRPDFLEKTITPLVRCAFDIIKRTQFKDVGPHRQGSGAVTHYTMLELADRFKLMNLAFDQEDYRVDKNLEVVH